MQFYKEDPNYLLLDFSRYLADNHVVVIGMTDGSLEEHFKVYLREKDYKKPEDMERFIRLFKFFFMTPDLGMVFKTLPLALSEVRRRA